MNATTMTSGMSLQFLWSSARSEHQISTVLRVVLLVTGHPRSTNIITCHLRKERYSPFPTRNRLFPCLVSTAQINQGFFECH